MATRLATYDDLAVVTHLLGELRGHAIEAKTIDRQFQIVVKKDTSVVMLVGDKGSADGLAVINLVYKLPKCEARIDEVIVSSKTRGKGYGKELIRACEVWAWEHGAEVIEFTSRPSRTVANGLYQSLGYVVRDTNVYQKKEQI